MYVEKYRIYPKYLKNWRKSMIKRQVLLVMAALFLASLTSPVLSQNKPLNFGLRVGLTSSSVNEDVLPSALEDDGLEVSAQRKRRNTFTGGGFIEYWFGSSFALQLNALYLKKGVRIDSELEGSVFDQGFTVNVFGETKQSLLVSYLSFPLLAKLAIGGGNAGAVKPFIMAGPEVGYLLSAEITDLEGEIQFYVPALAGGAFEINEAGLDIKDDIESLEYAFNFGAGIIFPLGEAKILLDGWYSMGLSKINKEGSESTKNNVLLLNLGLMF
jgi:hypothetical protein